MTEKKYEFIMRVKDAEIVKIDRGLAVLSYIRFRGYDMHLGKDDFALLHIDELDEFKERYGISKPDEFRNYILLCQKRGEYTYVLRPLYVDLKSGEKVVKS